MQHILFQAASEVGGVLPLERFMELALYHPERGYYMQRRARVGRSGDFVTSPEITSLFGEMLAVQWVEVWERLGRPERFDLVELGAGSGQLAADLLTTARNFPKFAHALHYTIVENSPDFRARQQRRLAEACAVGFRVTWHPDLIALTTSLGEQVVGGVLSNEFFDALPVHGVEMTESGLRERGATWDGERWQAVSMPLSDGVAAEYFARRGITLATGYQTELGRQGWEWMHRLGTILRRGVIVTIDYGYPEREYYHPVHHAGHLVGHRQHVRVDDPLASPGEMDLTAHVDFSALAKSGERAGLKTLGFTTQGWFLLGLGILARLEKLLTHDRMTPEGREQLQRAVQRLIMPDAMGERFKVLAQGRGLDSDTVLAGFGLNDQRRRL
ncbi:MAG: SAM-dependent methyltransferase [Magnetococcales bacterium]|nr:SAM-dependent methyltransferase [Magnetococcales bacterium]MBF0321912.1 SAM-dependent methyltransferase [Magnetococcales bacterium]